MSDTADTNQSAPVGKAFILAGRAVFTIVGIQHRFTFKVNRKEPKPGSKYGASYFIGVKITSAVGQVRHTGDPEQDREYAYLGILNSRDGSIITTKNSQVLPNSPSVVALKWTLAKVWGHHPLGSVKVLHAGRCGRCGRELTDPESIRSGFGPECRNQTGMP